MMPVSWTVTESKRATEAKRRSETCEMSNGSTPSIWPFSATCGLASVPSVSATMTLPTRPSVWMSARLSSRIRLRARSSMSIRTVIGSPGASGSATSSTRPTEMPL